MPINGAPSKPKTTGSVQKPSWLRDEPVQLKNVRPAWAKSKSISKQDSKSESSDGEKKEYIPCPANPIKKETKLQSREIKVPFTIEKKAAAQPPLKKPDPKPEPKVEPVVEVKKDPKIVVIRNNAKLPTKSESSSKSTTPSKSPTPLKSTTPSKASTPSKSTTSSKSTTPSKSPSKTPDYTEESDDEDDSDFTEEEEEEEEEETTESESEEEVSLENIKKNFEGMFLVLTDFLK